MDSKEFPPLPELENSKGFTLAKEEMSIMLKSVSYAQSVNEERYMLKGVFFQMDEKKISLVATDGRRLAVTTKEGKNNPENKGEFILPSLTVAELERLPGVAKNIELNYTDRQVSLKMDVTDGTDETNGFHDSIYLVSKVVEGKYPNFNQVIPKDDFNQATVERELMLECVNRAALVSDEKVTLRVKPKGNGNFWSEYTGRRQRIDEY